MKKVKIPRNMNESGRPEDGLYIEPSDIFLTNTGRTTTPYPSKNISNLQTYGC